VAAALSESDTLQEAAVATPQPARVSVVIPCYNQGRFLLEAIESVRGQSHPAAEILVVDDGSTDHTADVAQACDDVRYIAQSNQGAPAARNNGLRASTGTFLVFLDADDRLLPNAIAAAAAALTEHPDWGFVSGQVRVIDVDGRVRRTPRHERREVYDYMELLRGNYIWTPGAVMYRRTALEVVNGFNPSAGGSADYELNVRIARRFAIGCIDDVILDYRQHPNSMSNDARYMLKWSVSVRRAERKHASERPGGDEASRQGISLVQQRYGERLVMQMKADLRTPGRWRRAVMDAWYLFRYYPAGAMRLVRGAFRRMVRGPRLSSFRKLPR
jgi:glycosyltransferase involved in cell wall biosynthesis